MDELKEKIKKLKEITENICKECIMIHGNCIKCNFDNVYNLSHDIYHVMERLEIKKEIKERMKKNE